MNDSALSYLQRLARRGSGWPGTSRLMPAGQPSFPPPLRLGGEAHQPAPREEGSRQPFVMPQTRESRQDSIAQAAGRETRLMKSASPALPRDAPMSDDPQDGPTHNPTRTDPRPDVQPATRQFDGAGNAPLATAVAMPQKSSGQILGQSPTGGVPEAQPAAESAPPPAAQGLKNEQTETPQRGEGVAASSRHTVQTAEVRARTEKPEPVAAPSRAQISEPPDTAVVLVEPATAPSKLLPQAHLPSAARSADQPETAGPITVHIGTIEVQGMQSSQPPTLPARPRAKGFGNYVSMRSYASWERDR